MSEEKPLTVVAAERTVDKMVKAIRLQRIWIAVLAVICVLMVAYGIVIGVVLVRGKDLVQTVQHGSITSCQSGNRARATNEKIWGQFINVLLKSDKASVTSSAFKNMQKQVAALPASPEKTVFEAWIIIQTHNNASSAYQGTAKQFEQFIAANEKQQACEQLYGK